MPGFLDKSLADFCENFVGFFFVGFQRELLDFFAFHGFAASYTNEKSYCASFFEITVLFDAA